MNLLILLFVVVGCGPAVTSIGRPGTGDGEFKDPRGIGVSKHGVAVLDRTGRLQLFDLDGRFRRALTVVAGDVRRGHPTGVVWLSDGRLLLAHTHLSRILEMEQDGRVVRAFGEYGAKPGQFLYPQRLAFDDDGDLLVSEYGIVSTNRVQVLRPDGTVLRVLGGGLDAEGGLGRPMGAVPLPGGRVLVADERAGLVQFDAEGRATPFGPRLDESSCCTGVCVGDDGDVYVCDRTKHEVRRHAPDGTLRGAYGGFGDAPERFREPWDVAWHDGRVYVADMGNHRVARIDPARVEWRRP